MDVIRINIDFKRVSYQMIHQQEEQENNKQPDEEFMPLPEYGEVEGAQIKLKGLDYNLLHQQSKNHNKAFLDQVKEKLDRFQFKSKQDQISSTYHKYLEFDNDELSRKIITSSNAKYKTNQSIFYLFDTKFNFGHVMPEIISKRMGKMHNEPIYINHSEDVIEQFKHWMTEDEAYKEKVKQERQQNQDIFDEPNHSEASLDMFDEEEAQPLENDPPKIKIGKKLTFGIDEQQIYSQNNYEEFKRKIKVQEDAPKIPDKYQFMRKKVKPNLEPIDDGYGECYAETGPSLDEMKELKKQGIELFGDQKVFKQKERKINLSKDYEKIKKIIDQKSKK